MRYDYITTYEAVVPSASGLHDVGTLSTAFASGVFDNLEVGNKIYAKTYYGDGSSLTGVGATPGGSDMQLQYNDGGDLGGVTYLTWNNGSVELTLSGDMLSSASGVPGFGSSSIPMGNGYFDLLRVYDGPSNDQDVVPKIYVDSRLLWQESGGDVELITADDLDIQNMQMKNMCLDNRTSDPVTPSTGLLWIRTDV